MEENALPCGKHGRVELTMTSCNLPAGDAELNLTSLLEQKVKGKKRLEEGRRMGG